MNFHVAPVLQREREIARHIEDVIDLDAERGRTFPTDAERRRYARSFNRFKEWAAEHGVPALPCTGYTAAMYLLDMLVYREPLGEIECAGDAIRFTHDMAEYYLDRTPIDAVMALTARGRS
jgi:hypothetical protein